jgi:hypothetical protein
MQRRLLAAIDHGDQHSGIAQPVVHEQFAHVRVQHVVAIVGNRIVEMLLCGALAEILRRIMRSQGMNHHALSRSSLSQGIMG